MRARKPQPSRTLSPKTGWTAVWFALLGLTAFHCYGVLRPKTEEPTEREAPAGPLPTPTAKMAMSQPLPSVPWEWRAKDQGLSRLPLDDEKTKGAGLCPFFKALQGLAAGRSEHPSVRVLHIGDSISTTDEISGQIRRVLQARFGDGGHGFVLMGKPWRWYRHQNVVHGAQGAWRARPVNSDPVGDGLYGLGGVGLESQSRGAAAWVGPATEGVIGAKVRSVDLSYLEQPLGGTFDLLVDGQLVDSISTRSQSRAVAHRMVDLAAGQAKLMLRARGDGWIRVFGAALDSGDPGVVYDTVAVNGARAQALNLIKPKDWESEVALRDPSLVVLMLGANEGTGEKLGASTYKHELSRLLATVKSNDENRACLLVGPLDQVQRDGPRRWKPRPNPARITAIQRQVALENGCAFFDVLAAMGGPGSFATWLERGLGGADLLHPTSQGGRLVGDWIVKALLNGYDDFIKDEQKCALNVTTL
ncbi:MAG: GDSL-type esterase/lipase family protein [Myxococcota bacterium]|nr:GDSL-type esterase/lipase family protein [Myxococcota bacterium]